ncbi:MAG: cobalamin-dependent protein [Candidatus Sericytochromatia bacterium]|nr:cobalamin-dependent protein [Candidatus Sericytochromatia bacterium]
MARVLFLSPPRRLDGTRTLFNHATLTLASHLARRGQESRLVPLVGPDWPGQLESYLEAYRPDVAAISCKWWDTLFGATEVARRVKQHRSAIRTLAGGQTATSFATELVNRGLFDAVIRGDGEEPLLAYAQGRTGPNLTWLDDGVVRQTEQTYVQRADSPENLTLLDDLTELADPSLLKWVGREVPFVWTGKGCRSTCLYCAGSALGHKRLFNRTGYVYRPVEQVVHDMEVLAPWSGGTFLFDFDPVTDPAKESYYHELFENLPQGRFHALFYCWSLPTRDFVERISQTFATAVVGIDVQTYSEPLRQRLAQRAWIKPFSPDADILDRLEAIKDAGNLSASVYGILGLASETQEDVTRAESFLETLDERFGDILHELALTPLSIEPGALVSGTPAKYGMVPLRQTLDDYLAHTGQAWLTRLGFHDQPWTGEGPHPFGLHGEGESPDRVYRDYQKLQERLRAMERAREERRATAALEFTETEVRLTLSNRTVFDPQWHLVPWAVENAVTWKRPRVRIDARNAWIKVPDSESLAFDERYEETVRGLASMKDSLGNDNLTIVIEGRTNQDWGALQEMIGPTNQA